jgi:hypothetical protein
MRRLSQFDWAIGANALPRLSAVRYLWECPGRGGTSAVPARPRHLKGCGTVKELAEELGFPSERACREWLSPAEVPSVWRGRVIRELRKI